MILFWKPNKKRKDKSVTILTVSIKYMEKKVVFVRKNIFHLNIKSVNLLQNC